MRKWGLLFDLDDTLIDSEAAYAYALYEVDINPLGEHYSNARSTIKARLGPGHVGARNRFLYFKELLLVENRYTHAALMSLMDKYERALESHVRNQWQSLKRDVFFHTLSGIPRAIITNENARTQTLKLRAIDPSGDIFPAVLTSEEIGAEKPNTKLFIAGMAKLGVAKDHCIVIGDSLESDILPALELGCRAVLTAEFKVRPKEIPSSVPVISRLEELAELLV